MESTEKNASNKSNPFSGTASSSLDTWMRAASRELLFAIASNPLFVSPESPGVASGPTWALGLPASCREWQAFLLTPEPRTAAEGAHNLASVNSLSLSLLRLNGRLSTVLTHTFSPPSQSVAKFTRASNFFFFPDPGGKL